MNKNKTATAVALFLALGFALSIFPMPTAEAHTPPWTIVSYAYIVPSPNPVGVGQKVSIVMWIDTPLPNAAVENDIRRTGYKLTITKPDGTSETRDWPIVTDTTSVQYYSYIPDKVGTYTLKFDYTGQTYTWNATSGMRTYTGDIFTAASKTTTLTVQEEPLPQPTTSYPLPTEYWTRPIEGQNTDWWSISSNWLGEPFIPSGSAVGGGTSGNYFGRIQPYGTGPNSPHVMWSKPIQDGGVIGGRGYNVDGTTYYMGGSYNTRFSNALIMYGRLYYQEPYGNSGGGGDYVCVNLRTGAEIWRINVTEGGVPSFGYLYALDSPNQHGALPEGLLFTNNFARAYDPSTGVLTTMNITNVPSGTAVPGYQGEVIRYQLDSTRKWIAQWNSSKAIGGASGTGVGSWYSGTINASLASRYDWNITIPSLLPGTWRIDRAQLDDIMLLVQGSFGGHVGATGATVSSDGANITAISLKPTSRGQILWTKYYPPAPGNVTRALAAWDTDLRVFAFHDKETMVNYGYSLDNGNLLWGPTEPTNDYTYFRNQPTTAYGKLYWAGYGGILHCYDMKTGELLWTYGNGGPGNSTNSGLENPWGNYPIFVDVIADGKIYLGTTEHSPGSPFYKDTRYRCVNATTGEEIWTMMGWGTGMDSTYDRVADGFFVYLNCYDMKIYTVGKGPSTMTVDAPKTGIKLGESLIISGTVTDTAEGTKQEEQAARFPNGVAAVSDQSMSAWMEYVYMQKPRPTDVTGVEVTISVLDANDNYREIGKTTSDSDSFFSLAWKPDIEGKYTVYASFAGSESYWPSHAVAAFVVDPAPQTESPEYPQPVDNTMTIVGIGAAILAAIAIVGVVLALLLLRKRP